MPFCGSVTDWKPDSQIAVICRNVSCNQGWLSTARRGTRLQDNGDDSRPAETGQGRNMRGTSDANRSAHR